MQLQRIAAVTVGIGLLALSPMQASAAGFDTGLEGWEAWGFDIDYTLGLPPVLNSITYVDNTNAPPVSDIEWLSTGGNPGGYASLTDAVETPASFARAPTSFIQNGGNLTPFLGGTFSFDHKLFATGTTSEPIAPYSVMMVSGDPTLLNAVVWTSTGPGGATDWVHHDAILNSGNFSLLENTDLGVFDPDLAGLTLGAFGFHGTMTFEQILASVSDIFVGFELVNNEGLQNQEHAGLDNIQLVALPEPASILLLLMGGAMFLARRKR